VFSGKSKAVNQILNINNYLLKLIQISIVCLTLNLVFFTKVSYIKKRYKITILRLEIDSTFFQETQGKFE